MARDLDLPLGTDGLVIPDEMLEDAWEEAEEDEILSRLPQRLRDFFRDLKIHPATVRDVMLRGGVKE